VKHPSASGTNDAASACVKVTLADFANLTLLGIPAALQRKLDGAALVPTEEVPPDAVTMLSRVVVADAAGGRREITVVYPAEADPAAGLVSVLDQLGTALFAAAVGEMIEYDAPEGPCRLLVEDILYQPERWMRKNLVVRE
jgi:regulator of nucleoside diphosphate kinase